VLPRLVWHMLHPHRLDNFRINIPSDEDRFEWLAKPGDAACFKHARQGDHLITPFQCD
jgi:hypothetical protein